MCYYVDVCVNVCAHSCVHIHTYVIVHSLVHMYLCLYMRVHVYEMHMFFLCVYTGMTCVCMLLFSSMGVHMYSSS